MAGRRAGEGKETQMASWAGPGGGGACHQELGGQYWQAEWERLRQLCGGEHTVGKGE